MKGMNIQYIDAEILVTRSNLAFHRCRLNCGIVCLCNFKVRAYLCICPIPEGIKDLLHSHDLSRLPVHCFPHDAVGLRQTQQMASGAAQPISRSTALSGTRANCRTRTAVCPPQTCRLDESCSTGKKNEKKRRMQTVAEIKKAPLV